jgi:tRNA A-37 threonylcarbamoyl transferase component Bud32
MNKLIYKRTFKDLILCKRGRYTPEMEKLLKNPEIAFNIPAELLLKNGNSATITKFTIDGSEVVIKRYNMKTITHALRRAFKKSRADHSWKHAHIIKKMGIRTPYPVAMKEKRFGVFRNKAFFICDYIEGPTAFDYFKDKKIKNHDKKIMAEKTIKMLNKLKSSMISHGDMKATNIIIHGNEPFILDLDSMKIHKNKYLFNKAWQKDMKRFIKNWDGSPELNKLFKKIQY